MIEKAENKVGCRHLAYIPQGGVLVCASCGTPSASPKWRANMFGRGEAARMEEAEREVQRMSEKEKMAAIKPILDPSNRMLLQWGAYKKLTYAQALICFEQKIKRPEDLPENTLDAGIIRQQAPEDLKRRLAEAEARRDKAESLLQSAKELYSGALNQRHKLGSRASEFAFAEGVPPEILERYNGAQNKTQVAEELIKEAERACEVPRAEYCNATAALDRWVLLEQARRQDVAQQRDFAGNPTSLSLADRLTIAAGG